MPKHPVNKFLRYSQVVLSTFIVLVTMGNLACNSKPKDALLAEIKKSEVPSEENAPAMWVIMKGQRAGNVMNPDFNNKLHSSMELLATKFGFRIEVGSIKPNMFMGAVKTYEIKDFSAPNLPGLTLKSGNVAGIPIVNITPDYHREMVIEEASDPKIGMRKYQESDPSKLIEDATWLKAMGIQVSAGAAKEISKITAVQKENALKLFVDNVERIRQDKGYKRAWFIRYRVKESSTVPADSPFWDLCDTALLAGKVAYADIGIGTSPWFTASSAFWAAHGQLDTKAALQQHIVVAFEGADGKLAKLEDWNSFI